MRDAKETYMLQKKEKKGTNKGMTYRIVKTNDYLNVSQQRKSSIHT